MRKSTSHRFSFAMKLLFTWKSWPKVFVFFKQFDSVNLSRRRWKQPRRQLLQLLLIEPLWGEIASKWFPFIKNAITPPGVLQSPHCINSKHRSAYSQWILRWGWGTTSQSTVPLEKQNGAPRPPFGTYEYIHVHPLYLKLTSRLFAYRGIHSE